MNTFKNFCGTFTTPKLLLISINQEFHGITHLCHETKSVILEMSRSCMSVALETETKASTVHVLGQAPVTGAANHLYIMVRSVLSAMKCGCLELAQRQQSQDAGMDCAPSRLPSTPPTLSRWGSLRSGILRRGRGANPFRWFLLSCSHPCLVGAPQRPCCPIDTTSAAESSHLYLACYLASQPARRSLGAFERLRDGQCPQPYEARCDPRDPLKT